MEVIVDSNLFPQDINEQSYKQQPLFEIGIICNIINVFTVTFDQFNVCLLKKSNNVLKESLDDPKLLNSSVCFKSFNIISVLWQLPGINTFSSQCNLIKGSRNKQQHFITASQC